MRRSFLLRIMTSNKNAAAAVTRATDGAVVASASTAEKGLIGGAGAEGGVSRASVEHHRAVGARLAARAAEAGIQEVSWVRKSGQQFHGRARAVLEGLRGGGVGLV